MTTPSIRCILHNPFYCGKVNYLGQLLMGIHDQVVPEELFQTVKYDRVASRYAAEGVDHSDYLLPLSEQELIDRNYRMVDAGSKRPVSPP